MMKKQVMKLTPPTRVRMNAIRSASSLSADTFPPVLLPKYAKASSIQSSLIARNRCMKYALSRLAPLAVLAQFGACLAFLVLPSKCLRFRQSSAAPIATPSAIQIGASVKTTATAPIAVPAPIQLPAVPELPVFIHKILLTAHSTVTLLARLRGLSTSVPLATAT